MRWREILSWCLYDFANSSYSAVIAAVVFPVYFVNKVAPSQEIGDLWWGRAISLSMAIVAISSPFMGGIADHSGRRKLMLFLYTLTCVCSVSLLAFSEKVSLLVTVTLIIIANTSMEGGLVFYNAYLPDIVPRMYYGRVSGWGFSLGYLGSVLSLLGGALLIKMGVVEIVWPMVSVFFLIFSLPLFICLPGDSPKLGILSSSVKGLRKSLETFKKIMRDGDLRRFLFSYFFYKDAVNTIIVFSSIFASVTLKFAQDELILLYLVVQLMAMIGAFVFASPSDRWGPKKVVTLMVFFWTFLTICALFVNKVLFWIIAIIGGFGLGSIQSASRALFSGFIPEGHEAEYFGFYSFVGKSSAILGPLLFGSISFLTGNQRVALLSIIVLFILGLIYLIPLRDPLRQDHSL
jgi:UMF1 family MFS transporter